MPAMFQGNARPDTDPSLSRDTLRPTAVPGPPACLARAPLRRELSDRTWCGVPCWWSATRWVDHVRLVYLRHYQVLRPRLCAGTGGGVSLEAVMAVAATHAGVADYRTGRSSRPLLGTRESATGLVVATGLGARTVSRVRTFLRLAGLATEVAGGRQRSLAERLESWRRGDRSRGWTADYALHPSRTHPVEAGVSLDGDRCCVGGTPPAVVQFPPPLRHQLGFLRQDNDELLSETVQAAASTQAHCALRSAGATTLVRPAGSPRRHRWRGPHCWIFRRSTGGPRQT